MGKTFWSDVKRGNIGELVVYDYLMGLENIKAILDVRKDKRYFNKEDVDFLIMDLKNNIYKAEIKTDYKAHETNNIFYEIQTLQDKGCFNRTKSDIVYYYIPESNVLLRIDVYKIKKYVSDNRNILKLISGGDYGTSGYLLNIDDLEKADILKKIENI